MSKKTAIVDDGLDFEDTTDHETQITRVVVCPTCYKQIEYSAPKNASILASSGPVLGISMAFAASRFVAQSAIERYKYRCPLSASVTSLTNWSSAMYRLEVWKLDKVARSKAACAIAVPLFDKIELKLTMEDTLVTRQSKLHIEARCGALKFVVSGYYDGVLITISLGPHEVAYRRGALVDVLKLTNELMAEKVGRVSFGDGFGWN